MIEINKVYEKLKDNFKAEPEILKKILSVWISGGHLLLNDKPGTGKTTLAKLLAGMVSAKFNRIQFTPDVTPSDIVGINILDMKQGNWNFNPGPVFSNILLADEINRAPPRTQSALLEVMAEKQITIDGVTRKLADSFFVIATQNPLEFEGTYPLPEAQNDRFSMRLSLGEKTIEEEMDIILGKYNFNGIEPLMTLTEWEEIKNKANNVIVNKDIALYVVNILNETRKDLRLINGSSSRGGQALINCAKAYALIEGRDFVIPDDIFKLASSVLAHRVSLNQVTYLDNSDEEQIIEDIIRKINPGLTIHEKK